MKKLLPLALVIAIAGCQTGGDKPAENPPDASPNQSTPTKTDTAEVKGTDPVATTTTGNAPIEEPHPNYISERLHQLADYPIDYIEVNGHKLKVYLALNESNRAEGLMHVLDQHLNMNTGMLFAFKDEQPRSFWMQNTKIDLDLAYIATSGKIQSTHHMKALDEKPVPGKGPAMYVLEMKFGAFKQFGIKEGQIVKIPATVKSED